jgi:ADP-ribose pyrophosphatase YjhB (NUDIX family)
MDQYKFQYCQKIVVYSAAETEVLLCRRRQEVDFAATFSFIGGKMEIKDQGFVDSLRREKNEEVGPDFKIKIFPAFTANVLFTKKDGNSMVLPHYYAIYERGAIKLNDEYSEFKWVPLTEIDSFAPKIYTIPGVLAKFQILKKIIKETKGVVI